MHTSVPWCFVYVLINCFAFYCTDSLIKFYKEKENIIDNTINNTISKI